MSDPTMNNAEIQVIKQAILGFVDAMSTEKRKFEQQIRERTENVRSSVIGSGASQFSYQDVDGLSRQYKDEFLNIYRNTIHLNILANGSRFIKSAIQQGLISADIVQQEWLEGFEALQNQINQYQDVSDRADLLETQLEGNRAIQGDVSELQALLREKDVLIAEKDTEIVNLNEGLARMENQVNTMGQNMLENQMMIEELQEAINERDVRNSQLQVQLKDATGSSADLENLQIQLQESKDRERELQVQASSASTELVTTLQDNLEKTREQVLELRRDLVQKNEEMHTYRMAQDEYNIKLKQHEDKITELREEKTKLDASSQQISDELKDVSSKNSTISEELSEKSGRLTVVTEELSVANSELVELKTQLQGYEGKVAMSTEEQEKINQEINTVKSQLELYESTVDYLKGILSEDVKFKIMNLMSTMSERVRLDDLAESVEIPEKVVLRAAIELSNQGVVELKKEGRFVYCTLSTDLRPPQLLVVE